MKKNYLPADRAEIYDKTIRVQCRGISERQRTFSVLGRFAYRPVNDYLTIVA